MGKRVTIEMNQSYAQCQQNHYNGFEFHTVSKVLNREELIVQNTMPEFDFSYFR